MDNIVTYVKLQQDTFKENPFNPVDSLVLSALSYLDFGLTAYGDPFESGSLKLHDVLALSDKKLLVQKNWLRNSKSTDDFWSALMASRRYRDVTVGFYVDEISSTVEKQFSAVSFFLPHDMIFIAFRGTDGSFVGWKEDFNLCFKDVIPSQLSAARYASGIASATSVPLMLGGHSKGGHLAEYAALLVDEKSFSRIIKVYNHDGPSFLDDPSPRIKLPSYNAKLHKMVPESSAIGMLLEKRSNYSVVCSVGNFIFQHEPFNWIVDGNDF